MDKQRRIGKIFKILPMKESLDEGNITLTEFRSYISKQYIQFEGSNLSTNDYEDIVEMLNGLKKLCGELTHNEVHDIVLRITNMIDRGC